MTDPHDREGFVGRGALKLKAALELLGGAEKVKGAECIDVGASTGGFTEYMLQLGATRVVAFDVGHDQLAPKLREDPRVENLERTNFKTVSLKVGAGPFDFFAVDVSFVSARNMLRPLAFRLKKGAEGFILVKPQFELPTGYVKGGDVKAPRLRTWALNRVKDKGEELGFELLGHTDSPVVGGSGTVEILTRWRFNGMPEGAPKKKPESEEPPPPDLEDPLTLLATTARGLEKVLAKELAAVKGVSEVKPIEDGVELKAPRALLPELHQRAHAAERLLIHLGRAKVTGRKQLAGAFDDLPFSAVAEGPRTLEVVALSRGARALPEPQVKDAVEKAARKAVKSSGHAPLLRLEVRAQNDVVHVYADAPGELNPLFFWAGVLELCGWTKETPLRDPLGGESPVLACAARLGGMDFGAATDGALPASGVVATDATKLKGRQLTQALEGLRSVLVDRLPGWSAGILVSDAKAARTALGLRTIDEPRLILHGTPLVLLRIAPRR